MVFWKTIAFWKTVHGTITLKHAFFKYLYEHSAWQG